MKAGKYSIKELFVNRFLEQIVIPEIQRDYVWKEEQVIGLLNSIILDFKNFQNAKPSVIVADNKEIETAFHEFDRKRKYSSNIGFIYAYNDEQLPGRYFLIDGQQRITTIFLTLLTLAHGNKNLRELFVRTYIKDKNLKLDYRVREASHNFLIKMVDFVLGTSDEITDQHWYLSDYKTDVTIINLLNNQKIINKYLNEQSINETDFFHFIEDYTEFWYFDTNVSEQGEELYIYMNARGEQMQSNENIKADLLSKLNDLKQKNQFGKIWEEWQDYFWLNKDQNENADPGFNEFLTCISGLENYKIGNKDLFYTPKDFKDNNGIKAITLISNLNLSIIEKYIQGLTFLMGNTEHFKALYKYSGWLDKSINLIWSILNNEKTNWYADYTDNDRSTERQKMVYLWSILKYLSEVDLQNVSIEEIYRFLRMYYLRYHNNNRSVSTINDTVSIILINGVFDSTNNDIDGELESDGSRTIQTSDEETDYKNRTQEEILKTNLYIKHILNPELLKEYENLIWQIEDHDFNLEGRDVGGKNISHLVDLNTDITLKELQKIRDKFYAIFPDGQKAYLTVQNILLYYDEFWYRATPSYYFNFEFDNWRRIIRGIGKEKSEFRTAFNDFFLDFVKFDGSINEFLIEKRKILIDFKNATDLREKLLWYNQYLGNQMWSQGNHIAFSNGWQSSIPDWQNKDKVFPDTFILYNIKGDLKGGTPKVLYQILPEEIKKVIDSNLE
ncbi:Protein of unknown function DUF262 [Daejeonella rubra]|uniref:GmrSD restriction endonucleases N-terminal domain-containing protein n=1 Tax=Daejeonella rubra TaxID=990371 RepID=A0A1G9YB55_9SPHI|nr:DUF262 domain-containing protein [Daejeonella rubra]SDN06318.1 Protein of unknown function DUF262 [Daejeonella rubra]